MRRNWSFGAVAAIMLAALAGLPAALPARAAVSAPAAGGPSATAANSGTGQSGVAVLDVVMLVDESGSETPQKVADEKQTAGTIVQTMLNPASRVTVIGFGGVNNVTQGQNPVDVVCQPTIASGQPNLDYLSSCVGKLHRRSEQEGNDTDYAAALSEAMNYLAPGSTATPASPPSATKVILMMTDGAVDVRRNTQQYGSNWTLGEQTAIDQQLAAAKSAGVQLWPLGFGTAVGTNVTQPQAEQYLNRMAAMGAAVTCKTRQAPSQPHATWVNDPADAIDAMNQLYDDAGCFGSQTRKGSVDPGTPRTFTLDIPAIASAAAISVDRVNPAIAVAFTAPDGTAWTDSTAISGADSNSPVEVLHLNDITKPDVGPWRITLTAPQNVASQLVSATVFWQGAVRAIVTATPSVNPGQPIAVKLTVLGPTGPITDPATLSSLIVGVTAAGQGLPSPVQVPVAALSGTSNVGTYAGTYTAPTQPTVLTIIGTASGYGLHATQIPATVTVGTASRGFNATPHFSGATSVGAGGSMSGSVDFTNQTGSARHVLLKLTASGTTATISPATPITVPSTTSGNPPSVPFTVTIDKSAAAGPASLEVQAVDATTGQVYNTAVQDFTVTKPPGFLAKYLWYIIGLIALILLAIAAWLARRKARRDAGNVQDLVAVLYHNGTEIGRLNALSRWSGSFRFIIRDPDGPAPQLDRPDPASAQFPEYLATRSKYRMEVRLLTPADGEPYDVTIGGPGESVDSHGNVIGFQVRPGRRLRGGKTRPLNRPPRRRGQGQPAAAVAGGSQGPSGWQGNGSWQAATNSQNGGWPQSSTQPTQSMPAPPWGASAYPAPGQVPPPQGPPVVPPPPPPVPPTTPQKKDDWL